MRLVFSGNCQIGALSAAYRMLVAPHTGDTVAFVYHAHIDMPASRQAMAQADVLIDQMVPMGRADPFAGIETKARRLCVPSVGAPFLWPYVGVGAPGSFGRYGAHNPFHNDFGDAWLVRRMAAPHSEDEVVSAYMQLDIGRAAHLDRRFELGMEIQEKLDRATGFAFAPIIAGRFRSERLFRTPYHAEPPINRHMVLRLLEQLGTAEAVRDIVASYFNASLYHPRELPIHPGVAAHFGLAYADARTQYRLQSETMLTFEQWARRFVRCEAYPEVSAAVEAVAAGSPGAEALLAAAKASLPLSPLVAFSEAILAVRAGCHETALPRLVSLAAAWPDLPDIDRYLFNCYEAAGMAAEAEQALRRDIARKPHLRPQYVRLARFLRALGRREEADAMQAVAVRLGGGRKRAGGMAPRPAGRWVDDGGLPEPHVIDRASQA